MRILGRLVALGLLATLLWKARGPEYRVVPLEIPYTDADDPFTPDSLRERLVRIAGVLGKIVGDPVEVADIRIVVADDRVEGTRAALEQDPNFFDPRSADYHRMGANIELAVRAARWLGYLGRYDSTTRTVQIFPACFEELKTAELSAVLDVVIAHELVHVWQDQQFGLAGDHTTSDTSEALVARAAIVEGSAEFLSRLVARRLGIEPSWETIATGKEERRVNPANSPGTVSAQQIHEWAYARGLAFVERVHEAGGGRDIWRRLFENPPRDVWSIEQPDHWIAHPRDVARDLDSWVKRFLANRARPILHIPMLRRWGHRPIVRADLHNRLEHAGIALDDAPWSGCRGGVLIHGRPFSGPLERTNILLRVWRLSSAEQATRARAQLVDAMRAHQFDGGITGRARMRKGEGLALSWTRFGAASTAPTEIVWAVRVEHDLVIEGLTTGAGVAPVLLALLGSEYVSRHDKVEDERAWLREPHVASEWLTALRPESKTERGPMLVAALDHEDSDVRRFALGQLAVEGCVPRPFAVEVPALVQSRMLSTDPAERAVAIAAADRLEAEMDLPFGTLDKLATSDSVLVRATLAGCRNLDAPRDVLQQDRDPEVRRIASAPKDTRRDLGDLLMDRITKRVDATSTEAPDDESDTAVLFDALLSSVSDGDSAQLHARILHLLRSDQPTLRLNGVMAARHLDEIPGAIAAELVRTFGSPILRRVTVDALSGESVNLTPIRSTLVGYLDHPRWRAASLQALAAAADGPAPPVLTRTQAWIKDHDPQVRCAAAVLLLRHGDAAVEDLQRVVLAAWPHVPPNLRAAAIKVSPKLVRAALSSPIHDECKAAAKAAIEAGRGAEILEVLPTMGPMVATELWGAYLDGADESEERILTLIEYLDRWSTETLPELALDDIYVPYLGIDNTALARKLIAALDRCIVLDSAPATRMVLTMVRLELEPDGESESAAVRDAIHDLISLRGAPDYVDWTVEQTVEKFLRERDGMSESQFSAYLMRRARQAFEGYGENGGIERYVREVPARRRAAQALLPELIRMNTRSSVELASQILELFPESTVKIPDTLPSWEPWLYR